MPRLKPINTIFNEMHDALTGLEQRIAPIIAHEPDLEKLAKVQALLNPAEVQPAVPGESQPEHKPTPRSRKKKGQINLDAQPGDETPPGG